MVGFFKKFVEAVTVKLIVEIIFAVVILVLGYLNRDMILSFLLLYQLPTWVTIAVAFSIIFLVGIALVIHSSSKGGGFVYAARHRPENPKYIFNVNMFSVKWKVLYGPYAFSEGPFCPKCMFEMDSEKKGLLIKKYYWRCVPCNKFYENPERFPFDAERAVEKYIESEIRSGHLKLEREN